MTDPSLEVLALLALAGFLAGWIDAVVGGGGLVQLPALLLGVPGATRTLTRPRSWKVGTWTVAPRVASAKDIKLSPPPGIGVGTSRSTSVASWRMVEPWSSTKMI